MKSVHQHFVLGWFCCFVTIDLRVAGYSPTGHRSLHASVGAGSVSVGSGVPGIGLDDERDSTGSHQSATAAAVAAAAAVRKSCLAGSHTSAPWRPQGKLLLLLMLSFLTPLPRLLTAVIVGFSGCFLSEVHDHDESSSLLIIDDTCWRVILIRLQFARCHCFTRYR